jgi:hypothetical protein
MKFKTVLVLFVVFCCETVLAQQPKIKPYVPVDEVLQKEIETLDKAFFDAYNSCDMKTQASFYSDEIEFFHDKAGLLKDKTTLLSATEKNICNKVTRHLIPNSIEVYPIADYGVIEIGYHWFFNKQEPDEPTKASKFIIFWKKENDTKATGWKITKVVSLH